MFNFSIAIIYNYLKKNLLKIALKEFVFYINSLEIGVVQQLPMLAVVLFYTVLNIFGVSLRGSGFASAIFINDEKANASPKTKACCCFRPVIKSI